MGNIKGGVGTQTLKINNLATGKIILTPTYVTVNFNSNTGGSPSFNSKIVTLGGSYGNLPDCSKTGYLLVGWFTSASGGTKIEYSTTVSNPSTHTLYAQWIIITSTVIFNANGGTIPNPIIKSVTYSSKYGTLATTSRAGHIFNGWFTARSGGTQITSDSTVSITSDQTLYAHWTPITSTVTFDSNGGVTANPTSKYVTYNSTYGTLATTSRTGYTFNGWFTAQSGGTQITSDSIVGISSNLTLYAQWTPNTYTVTFYGNGGTTPNPSSKNVTYMSTYGTLATTSRTGHTFKGWFTASSGGTQVLTTTTVTTAGHHSLFAQWTPDTYTLTFNANGGATPNPTSKSITYGSTYGTLATTSRTGHTFNGWFTSSSGGIQITSTSQVTRTTSTQTLYAQWTINTYEITFDGNGGTAPDPASKNVTYLSTYGTLATTSRTGYTFNGWFTAASGGTQIIPYSIVSITSAQTLYAQWTPNTYTVTFNGNGWTTLDPTSKSVTYGSTYGTLATVTRTGHTFNGWFTAPSGGTQVLTTTTVTTSSNHTLFAQWTPNSFVITLHANGGTTASNSQISVTYNTSIETFNTNMLPTRNGHTFNGYYTSTSGGTQRISSTGYTALTNTTYSSAATLYARWSANSYQVRFEGNGGTPPNPASKLVTYGSTYGTLATTSRPGYIFNGWFTAQSGGTQITSDSAVSITSPQRLYAQWTPITGSMKFAWIGTYSSDQGTQDFTLPAIPDPYTNVSIYYNADIYGEGDIIMVPDSDNSDYVYFEVIS